MMSTRTFAIMEVSRSVYEEVAERLRAAGYDHAFVDGDLDMHGIALRAQAVKEPVTPSDGHAFEPYTASHLVDYCCHCTATRLEHRR